MVCPLLVIAFATVCLASKQCYIINAILTSTFAHSACTDEGKYRATGELSIDSFLHWVLGGSEPRFNWTHFRVFNYFAICEDGEWREICDKHFTETDETVVCRQLGFSDIGVHMYQFTQYIGGPEKSRQYPECRGHEASLSICLVEHPDLPVPCMAQRVGVFCFPETMDPLIDLPLCGLKVPANIFLDSANTTGLPPADRHIITTQPESQSTANLSATFLVAGNSTNKFSVQSSLNIMLLFCLGATLAVLLASYMFDWYTGIH